jgi:hypothetical protein
VSVSIKGSTTLCEKKFEISLQPGLAESVVTLTVNVNGKILMLMDLFEDNGRLAAKRYTGIPSSDFNVESGPLTYFSYLRVDKY